MKTATRRAANQRVWIQLLVALLALTVTVWARADGLTLEQAVQQALAQNPELQAARYAAGVAQWRLQQAGLWPNPRLQLAGSSDRPFANEGQYSSSIGVSQAFPIAGRIARQKDVARVDVALVLAEINEAERRLAGQVAGLFYAVVTIDRAIALRDELIGIEQSLVDVTHNRLQVGEVSELDVNTVTLELERLTAERDVLLGDQGVAIAALAVGLGLPTQYKLELDTSLPPIKPRPALPVLENRAYARRPDLRIRALQTDRARAEKALARASAWEDWTVGLGVQQGRFAIDGAPRQSLDNELLLSFSVPLPLFNRNQGDIAAARALERQSIQGVAALRLAIAGEVAATFGELDRLARTLASQQQRMLPLSQRNAELARGAYGQGQISIIEVVQVERLRNELRANYLEIYGRYLQSRARLDMATGAWSDLAMRVREYPSITEIMEK